MGTRDAILEATILGLRQEGLTATSSRSVALRAAVKQPLIFYYFGTFSALLDQACQQVVDDSIGGYRSAFADVLTVSDLVAISRTLHAQEHAAGNVALMAQLMAAAQNDPAHAERARYAMQRWNITLEPVVARVLEASPLHGLFEVAGLTRTVTSGFIGLELYQGIDRAGAEDAFATLERLAAVVGVIEDLGPVARRAVQAKLRARGRNRQG